MRLFAAALFVLTSLHAADLVVAAASDFAPFTTAVEKAFPAARLRFSIGSSGSLMRQIENGAPFDVFLSANEQYVRELAAKNDLDPATVVVYATGRLGLWSADGSVRSLEDLTKPQVKQIAIPNPEFAPYGVAARKALETRGLWKQVERKIVYGENVRQALQFAESRNADAVITSWTLLKDRGVLLPAEWHDPIRQAGGVVTSSAHPALARQFLEFLRGPEGRKILEAHGLFEASNASRGERNRKRDESQARSTTGRKGFPQSIAEALSLWCGSNANWRRTSKTVSFQSGAGGG